MIYITKNDLKNSKIGYWYKTYDGRWPYIKEVIHILKSIDPDSVLELGSYGVPICFNSDTMDLPECSHLYERRLTYKHNANIIPWPITKKYDVFVALQVFEHLDNKKECFKEAKRLSNNIILSVPYKWKKDKLNKEHSNIDDKTILEWSDDIIPTLTIETGINIRKIYYWKLK